MILTSSQVTFSCFRQQFHHYGRICQVLQWWFLPVWYSPLIFPLGLDKEEFVQHIDEVAYHRCHLRVSVHQGYVPLCQGVCQKWSCEDNKSTDMVDMPIFCECMIPTSCSKPHALKNITITVSLWLTLLVVTACRGLTSKYSLNIHMWYAFLALPLLEMITTSPHKYICIWDYLS